MWEEDMNETTSEDLFDKLDNNLVQALKYAHQMVQRDRILEAQTCGRILRETKHPSTGFIRPKRFTYVLCKCGSVIKQHVAYHTGLQGRCHRCASNVWYQRQLAEWKETKRRDGQGAHSSAPNPEPMIAFGGEGCE